MASTFEPVVASAWTSSHAWDKNAPGDPFRTTVVEMCPAPGTPKVVSNRAVGPHRAMSLAPRLILTVLMPIVACFLVFGYATVQLRRRAMMDETEDDVRDHGTTLQVALDAFLRDHRVSEMAEIAEGLSRADRVLGVLVFDRYDHLASSSRSVTQYVRRFESMAHTARTSERVVAEVRRLESGVRVFVYAFPIGARSGTGPRGAAVLLRDLRYIDDNMVLFTRQLALGCLALMVTVTAAAWFVLRGSVLRPLAGLLHRVERVASGDLESESGTERNDELGRIAGAFNRMVASLRDAGAEIEAKNAANVALERRLQHAQRLALIGQIAASLAHQIGSPLNVVLGRARYALKQGGQADRDRRHFEEIVTGGEAISAAVEGLLTQARRVRGKATRIDLGALARDTLRFLDTECERGHVVATLDAEENVCVHAVRGELEQLLLNLCLNAIHAQPDGGRLRIRVERGDVNDAEGSAVISVADAGPGIPPDLREKVFEAFFTTRSAPEGTGLGLAICDEIVRRLGGTIVALESPEGGALVRVCLPEV